MGRKKHNYYTDCHKGKYILMNPDKYMEGLPEPEYKSEWEQKMFVVCDCNPFVTRWGYEPFTIAYHSPLYLKQSLYKPDIYLECRYADGHEEKYLIEVKPTSYSIVPKAPRPLPEGCTDKRKIDSYNRRKNAYDRKCMDVMVNYAKWNAAEAWCKARNINWFIANESNTRGLFKSSTTI